MEIHLSPLNEIGWKYFIQWILISNVCALNTAMFSICSFRRGVFKLVENLQICHCFTIYEFYEYRMKWNVLWAKKKKHMFWHYLHIPYPVIQYPFSFYRNQLNTQHTKCRMCILHFVMINIAFKLEYHHLLKK